MKRNHQRCHFWVAQCFSGNANGEQRYRECKKRNRISSYSTRSADVEERLTSDEDLKTSFFTADEIRGIANEDNCEDNGENTNVKEP